ncbi:LysM peptidoglycan-binding domain-containing protein [Bifidobacterium olomucense]|uniref:Peptidoglycan-binding LysM n=1 Tax=Bifidobacterium olomucense TaxID=2675324 RepID=A0A7Y0EWK1_9BIFI|nr:LysM peptidoglycan-binding domain-containing protein [Bifidobacterium sp. DSM 109959]NMM97761.1 peptidoglycan-binding LysM [Bifidobacterium sp. DSM 109959]
MTISHAITLRSGRHEVDLPNRVMRGVAGRSRSKHAGVLIVMLLVALYGMGLGAMLGQQDDHVGTAQVTSHIVQPGETLWGYATRITPAGQDVSETVDELMALNDLDSGELRVGQHIVVPVEQ